MKSVGEVAIVVGADLGPMNRELKRAEGGLKSFERSAMSMGNILGTAMGKVTLGAGAAGLAMAALTRRSMENIDAVSKQARAAGLSVASFQAMALVANEAGVETDSLSKMVVKLQDNIVQLGKGAGAQVAAFEALGLSMADLAGLSADEQFTKVAEALSKIKDPAERTAAALDAFGKSGADALNMVDGYAEAVASAAEFQRKLGLAITDTDAQNVEKANDAIGRMWMAFEGLGNVMATSLAPAMESTANFMVRVAEAAFGVRTNLEEFFGSLAEAKAILGEDLFNRMMGDPDAIFQNAEALDAINAEAERMSGIARNLEGEIRSFAAGLEMIGESGAASAAEALADEAGRVRQEFEDGKIPAEEFLQRMIGIQERAQGIVQEMANINGSDFSGIISSLGSLGAALGAALAKALKLRSALPGEEMTTGVGLESSDVASLMPPGSGSVTRSTRPRPAPNDIDFDIPAESNNGGGGGGSKGGGGLADKFARRLEIIVDALKTEQEVIQEWYEESRAMIEQASEDELAALGGKHEALERLEEEHQRRLKAIKDMGNQWSVDSVLKGGAEILSAMGSMNKKAMKAAGVVSAAQALISTYEGAAAELKKGTFGFASAAAVIAKGLGFVAAIKSAASGGEGGAGGGRGGAAVTQSAPPVQRMLIDYRGPEAAFPSFAALVDMMNQAGKAGYVLNAQITGRS